MAVVGLRRKRLEPTLEKKLLIKDKESNENLIWIHNNINMLYDKHPNMYIAVKNKQVAFATKSISELVEKITSSNGEVDDFVIQYINKKKLSLLL
jgi:hypothetical protein